MARNSHKNRGASRMASAILAATMLASPSAFAYLDPSTGSMVISAIVGIFASIALAMKTYWYKIKKFFRRSGQPGAPLQAESSGESPTEDSSSADRS